MANLLPESKQSFSDAAGKPLAGGQVWTYEAGTSIPLATYADADETASNANPVILNARGEATIFWAQRNYKVVLKDSQGVTIWTQDNVSMAHATAVVDEFVYSGSSSFTLSADPLSKGTIAVTVNGLALNPSQYSLAGTALNVSVPLLAGDEVAIRYQSPIKAGVQNASAVSFIQSGTGAVTRSAQDKMREVVSVSDFGADPTGQADSTAAIQAAIDFVYSRGGGNVSLPAGSYLVSSSRLQEVYDNAGAVVSASDCCLVVRKGVSLVGDGSSKCRIFTANSGALILALVAPEGNVISGLEVHANYPTVSGAGHGIFVLGTQGGADISCKKVTLQNLYIHNVGSYGIGLQCGIPVQCHIDNVLVENTGADGLDLKARSDSSILPSGNTCTNVTVRNFNLRVDGSAGIDVRGIWQLSGITVVDFGGDASRSYTGIRFRTKPPVTDLYNRAAANSTLTGFYVKPTSGAAALYIGGVSSGSDYVRISNGCVVGCDVGVSLDGNVNGSATYNSVVGVMAESSRQYGFKTSVGVGSSQFVGCSSTGAATAGFRNEGTTSVFVGCMSSAETPLSVSSGASPTHVALGCSFGSDFGVNIYQAASGRVAIEAKGASTDIDIALSPKGVGLLRFGTHVTNSDTPITGYMTIKDSSGVTRKLAVIA